jgi:hypothetical protein
VWDSTSHKVIIDKDIVCVISLGVLLRLYVEEA